MKTLTMRVDDDTYNSIKLAANGTKRNISNFLEFATMQYLNSSNFIDDVEMSEILNDKELIKKLKIGKQQVVNGEYSIV
jgi:predicted transcriptional regulator